MKRKGEKYFKNCRVVPCVPMDVDQSKKQKTANKDSQESLNDYYYKVSTFSLFY